MIKKLTLYLFNLIVVINFLSCTYDYFEDETNYVIYVPKADITHITEDYKVSDVHILIYKENLEREKKSSFPYEDNIRTKVGNFSFKLYPGSHSVYCFANTYIFDYFNLNTYESARFGLLPNDRNEYVYPNNMTDFYLENFRPTVILGPTVIDTVFLEKKYVGKICIAFKNIKINGTPLPFSEIAQVKIEASNIGVFQKFSMLSDSIQTRSDRYSLNDKVNLTAIPYKNPTEGFDFGIHNYYFPSLDESADKPLNLKVELLNRDGATLYLLNVEVQETLHMNQTIYLGVDGNRVHRLTIGSPQEWNSTINSEEDTTPGGGGIAV